MGPLRSQVHVPSPAADLPIPGPQPLQVWIPHSTPAPFKAQCCCADSAADSGAAATTDTFTGPNVFASTCQASDAIGALVYASGTGVKTADASLPLPVVGVIVAKSDATHCTVQTEGLISGLFSNLLANTQYFLGHTGQVISTPFDGTIEFVQGIGSPTDSSTLYLRLSGSAVRRDLSDP